MKHAGLEKIIWSTVICAALALGQWSSVAEISSQESNHYFLDGYQILLAGDSRSSTDYYFYGELLEEKTGAEILVEGVSGSNAAYNASDAYLEHVVQMKHDFSIWLVGGNDDGRAGSVGTFSVDSELAALGESLVAETDISLDYTGSTFIQAVDHMMRKYRVMTAEKGRNPVMIFCTDLPQQRDDADSPWSQQENWERKRLAIMECCEKNQVYCLDLYALCGFDMRLEPMFHPPTDREHDSGVFYMDGLHPNRRGFNVITNYEVDALRKFLAW